MKQHDFFSLQRRYRVVSRVCTRFNDFDYQRSRPKRDNKFPGISCGSLELVVVSKKAILEKPSNASSSYL